MVEKRRDTKGRVLRNGEVQRQDGKYMFRYTDVSGERKAIYSWRLVDTDKTPQGKRCCESLREMEKKVMLDVTDGIRGTDADKITLNDLFGRFMAIRTDLRETTRCNYLALYRKHVEDSIGRRPVSKLKYTNMFSFYMALNNEAGLCVSSIQNINAAIWQSLDLAVKDGVIRKNPADGVMRDVTKKLNETPKKQHALTIEQQAAFINYVNRSGKYERYRTLFTVMLGTGMRIGEVLGLSWDCVDFKRNTIFVKRSLRYKDTEHGRCEYHLSPPKTKAGVREIDMFSDVCSALRREKRKKRTSTSFTVDGVGDFVFINSAGKPYKPGFIHEVMNNIAADHNRDELLRVHGTDEEPIIIPKIGPHILRHTFCTRMCENTDNIKVVQETMGHKNSRTTMDVYNEATRAVKQNVFQSIDGKIQLT